MASDQTNPRERRFGRQTQHAEGALDDGIIVQDMERSGKNRTVFTSSPALCMYGLNLVSYPLIYLLDTHQLGHYIN